MRQVTISELHPWMPIWNMAGVVDLEDKLAELSDKAAAITARAEAEGRDLTPEESAEFDAVYTAYQATEALLATRKRTADAVAHMTRSYGRRTTPDGPDGRGAEPLTINQLYALQRTPGVTGRRFQDLFGHPARERETGFKSFNEFLTIITDGVYDPRLIKATGMSELDGASGGYLVPPQYASELLDAALESEIVRPRARVEPMESSRKLIGTLTNSDTSTSAPYGGLSLQWMQETGTITEKQAKTHLVTLNARKGAILVPVSNELLADGISVQRQLAEALISSVSWGMDVAFLRGNGAGKPLGVLNSPSLITVAKEVGQIADTINYPNVIKMFARLHPSCIANSVWACNSTAIPQLLSMNAVTDGVTFIPAVTQQANGAFSLLGRPVLLTEKVPPVGDLGDIILCDFSKYVVGLRQEISIDASGHAGFSTDETYLRVIVRVDGLGQWAKVVTPLNGVTQSWVVALAERS